MLRTTLLAAAAALLAAPVWAEGFTIFIHEPASEIALRTDAGEAGAAYWADWSAFSAALAQSGGLRGGTPLVAEAGDGLAVSGYFILDLPSRQDAESLAALSPAEARGGRTEVVPHFAAPGMTQ